MQAVARRAIARRAIAGIAKFLKAISSDVKVELQFDFTRRAGEIMHVYKTMMLKLNCSLISLTRQAK